MSNVEGDTDEPARKYLGRAVENGQLKPVSSIGGGDLFVTGDSVRTRTTCHGDATQRLA